MGKRLICRHVQTRNIFIASGTGYFTVYKCTDFEIKNVFHSKIETHHMYKYKFWNSKNLFLRFGISSGRNWRIVVFFFFLSSFVQIRTRKKIHTLQSIIVSLESLCYVGFLPLHQHSCCLFLTVYLLKNHLSCFPSVRILLITSWVIIEYVSFPF